jgi:hypothetical protein
MSSPWRLGFSIAMLATVGCGTRTISHGAAGDASVDSAETADTAPVVIPEVCSALPDGSKCPAETHLLGRSLDQQVECARAVAGAKCGALRAALEACRNSDPFCYDAAGKITNSPPDPCEKQKNESQACVEP